MREPEEAVRVVLRLDATEPVVVLSIVGSVDEQV
jgi:hypothetical protein